MRKGHASVTALAVASARALASASGRALVDPKDAMAEAMLPGPLASALRALSRTGVGRQVLSPALVRASLGMVDHLALRCALIDALLAAALDPGLAQDIEQVVIVGAGLDSRAHRLDALRRAHVYEVDHPSSQAQKRTRTAGLPIEAGALSYVAVDLSVAALGPALRDEGFDAAARSVFVIEGVVPYLRREATRELVRQLGNVCAPGSQVMVSYVPEGTRWLAHTRWLIDASLKLIGEPLGDLLSPEELHAMFTAAGFAIVRDDDTRAWAEVLCPQRAREPLIAYERLVLARRLE